MDKQMVVTSDFRALATGSDADQGKRAALAYLGSLTSTQSRRTMASALATIARLLTGNEEAGVGDVAWQRLTLELVTMIRTKLAEDYAPATANKLLAALRGTLKKAWLLGLMTAENYHRLAEAAKTVRGSTLPAGRDITSGELAGLMDTCANDATASGARDAAIVALLYSCGLRRAELVALDLADHDREARTLTIRGKGNKERLAHVVNGAAAALADWLIVRGDEPGPLFYRIRRGGHIQPQRLTTQAVYHILRTRAKQAGVKELSPHDFRRTFVGDLLDAGADIATVQQMAGHANVTTTARYDRRPEEAKRKAAERLRVPYRSRQLDI
jgi:site-specific recombinase XerD